MKPATYKRLFKKYKTIPVSGTYILSERLALAQLDPFGVECASCAVGIRIIHHYKDVKVARDRHYNRSAETINQDFRAYLAKNAGMSESFCRGLDNGWESVCCGGEGIFSIFPTDDEDYASGFTEGRAAAFACKPHASVYAFIESRRTD